jgi:hypothetical protein
MPAKIDFTGSSFLLILQPKSKGMIIKFRIISSETEDFIREIEIDSHCTFLTLHEFIQKELNYDSSQMASFFITDQGWMKETEITLIDMMENDNEALRVMDKTTLGEFLFEPKQRLLYVFDFFNERAFFMEIFEVTDGHCNTPCCIKTNGEPPAQIEIDNMLDDNNYDVSDEFDLLEEMDEFYREDEEGYDENSYENPESDY